MKFFLVKITKKREFDQNHRFFRIWAYTAFVHVLAHKKWKKSEIFPKLSKMSKKLSEDACQYPHHICRPPRKANITKKQILYQKRQYPFGFACTYTVQVTFGLSGRFPFEKNSKSQNLTLSNMTQNCIKIMFRVWKSWKKQLLLIFHQFWDRNCILKKKVGKILKKHKKCWIFEIFYQKYTENFKILLYPIWSKNA